MKDYFTFAYSSLRHRQLRSWLTVLGIVIGIAAIVALISLSQGLENAIVNQFEQMGSNRLFIAPGGTDMANYISQGLTTKDVDVVESVPGVDWVNPYIGVRSEVYFGNKKAFAQNIFGIKPSLMEKTWEDFDFELESGNMFKGNEKFDVIIGNDVAHKFFDKDVRVGNLIEIKGIKFKVKGILQKIGSPDDDQTITMPEETLRDLFNKPEEVSIIDVKVKDGINLDSFVTKIDRALKRSRDDEDYQLITPEQMLEQFGLILIIIQIILGGIATISLLVGGIGIMNSMYTNVLERTREIGIMKSIGATNKEIMMIFLVEAGLMGFIGGILGVVAGSLIALSIGAIAKQQGFQLLSVQIEPNLIIFGILFSFIVGALSGYFPAKEASKLSPVESLRYGI